VYYYILLIVAAYEEFYAKDGYKHYQEDVLKTVDDDSSSDAGNSQSFQEIAKKMVDVTTDGGVKKQTILHGIGEVIPSDANVLSMYRKFFQIYCIIVVSPWQFGAVGSDVGQINEVTVRRARLVLG